MQSVPVSPPPITMTFLSFAEIDAVLHRLSRIKELEDERDQQVAEGLTVPQNVLEILHSKRTLLTDD